MAEGGGNEFGAPHRMPLAFMVRSLLHLLRGELKSLLRSQVAILSEIRYVRTQLEDLHSGRLSVVRWTMKSPPDLSLPIALLKQRR
jgi:hypothetical protein